MSEKCKYCFGTGLKFNQETREKHLKANDVEQLQAANKELLSALEWIVSEIKDCAQPEDWESFDACEKAITNAKVAKAE